MNKSTLLLLAILLFCFGCGRPAQQQHKQIITNPPQKAGKSERRLGPAMLLYEAAEKDADVNNVIVTPPAKN